MESLTEKIIEKIKHIAHEQYDVFTGKCILSLAEDIKQMCEDEESESESENEFNKAVEPAIRYLLKNHNPHTKIYIDYDNAELLQGEQCHNLNEEIID